MPGNMDERVVSMEFDNKQFEKNVKTSMKTIDDLKESLDFDDTGKSFDQFTEKCKKFGKNNVFKDVDDSVSTLRKGIGLLGDSAGGLIRQFAEVTKITAMFELAEQAVNRLKNAVKSFTIEPISQGFDKYTTKISSIKTIANATGMAADKVDQSLDRLNWFTDETSASFSEMVNNIGKFTSVGKGLDESITAMQGIAAWGYHSGATVQEQNRVMYNLSQAMGTGSVKLIDWKSIENAGMATKEFKEQAIAAAEAAGTLTRKGDKLFAGKEEVNVENFNSTLSKGWFTSDVLMDTLKQYGSFADKVRKYQEEHPQYATAKDAMDAMDQERIETQQALYDKYLDTWSKNSKKTSNKVKEDIERINKIASVKEREKEIKAFAKSVGMSYEEVKKALDDLKDTEESLGEKAFKSSQQSKTFSDSIEATKDAVSTGWMNTFQYIFGGLDKSIELWSDVTDILWDLFAAGASFRNNAFMHWAEEFNGWADLWNANEENGPIGALRNIADTIIELKELLGSSFRNVFFPQLAKITGEVLGEEDAKTMAKNGLKTVDQLKNWREGNYMGSQIKQVTKGIREFTAKIRAFFTNEENLEKIRNIFTSIATSVRYAITVVGDFFDSIGSFINKSGIFRDILTVLSSIANKITEVFQKFQSSGFTKKLFGKISDGFVWFYNLIKGWIQQVKDFFEETGIGQAIRDFFKRIEEFFLGGENDVDETGKKTESGFFRAFGWLKNVKDWLSKINLKEILYDIKLVIDNFTTIWNTFVQALNGTQVSKDQLKSGGVSDKLAGILESVSSFGTKLSGIWQFIKGVFDKITGWLESIGILPAIRSAWDGIKTFFGNIGLVWEAFTKGSVADPSKLDEKQKGLVEGIVNFAANLRGAWEKVKGWATTAWNWIKEKFNLFIGWLESSGILPKLREWWDGIKKFFGNLGKTWNKIKLIAQNFSKVWEVFVNALNGKGYAPQMAAAGGSVKMTPLMRVLKDVSNFGKKLSGVYQFIKNIIEKIKDWLESSGILPWIRQAWTDIKNFFSGMFKGSDGSQGDSIIDKIRNFFANIWEAIKRFFSGEDGGPVAKIKEFFSGGVFETIKGWFIGENSIFKKIGDFISNLFGGGGNAAANAVGSTGEKKTGFFQSIAEAFTNDNGQFDLVKGLSTGITKLFETIGSIDWTSVSSNVFGVMVSIINGLDDACGKLHIDNILAVIRKIISVFTGVMIVKSISDITSTIRTIVKKGKDKGLLEKFTDLLASLGTALLQIGIAIALIAGSMWLISKIDEKRFGAALGVMIGIGVFLIGFMVIAYAMTRTMGKDANKLAKTFAAIGAMFLQIAIAVAIVVAAVWLVSLMLGENGEISDRLRNAMLIVGGIMLVMAGIVVMIGQLMKNVGTTNVAIGIATFAGIAILLAVCVAAILLLQNVDPKKAFTVVGEIAALLIAITVMLVVLSKAVKKFNPKMVVGMIVMAVMLGLVVAALVILKDAKGENLLAIAGSIAIIIGVLVAALVVCGLIGPKILVGAGVLAGALIILAVGLAAVAAMATGVMNNVLTFMSTLASVSNSAKLVDINAITNAFEALPVISTALGNVATVDVRPALNLVQSAWDVFTKMKNASFAAKVIDVEQFTRMFGEDGNGGILQTIQTAMSSVTNTGWKASALGRSVETLAENLKLVGQAGLTLIQDFDGHTYTEGIETVKTQLSAIQEIANIASFIGTIGEGENAKQIDLTSFAEGVGNIGAALELYNIALGKASEKFPKEGDVTAPISTENITAALTSVMSAMKDVQFDEGEIGNVESWAGLKKGEGGGTLFALGLTNIANAMEVFGQSAENFNNENVDKAISSLDKLADIKAKFETNSPADYKTMMEGVSQWGDGGDFKTAISGMGTAIAAFGSSVQNLPTNSVTNATNALDTLAVIYEKLKGEGTIESYLAKIGNLTIGGSSTTTKSVQDTFQGFAEGISKLADGLASFSASLTDESIGYDQTKVDAAVKILQDMTKIETELKSVKVDGNWWHDLLFGENGIKKLGENMSGLGSRLATFSQELSSAGGFDIDIDSQLWKNISGIITFMAGIQTEMNNLLWSSENYNAESGSYSSISNMSYTISDLADGMDRIREALVNFNNAMQKTYDAGNGNYKLGSWDMTNFENIKSVISFLKDITVDLKNAGLENNKFYDLENFGNDMQQMFNKLDNSKMGDFLSKLENFQSLTESLKTFSSFTGEEINLQGFELAAQLISGFASRLTSVDDSDGKGTLSGAFTSLLTEIDGYADDFKTKGDSSGKEFTSGFGKTDRNGKATLLNNIFDELLKSISAYEQQFFEKGKNIGKKFAEGFENRKNDGLGTGLIWHSEFQKSITDMITKLLEEIESHSTDFYDKGESAGKQYAAGFNQGLQDSGMGSLTPIVAMDQYGQTATGTGLSAILTSMGYATSLDISSLATRLDTIEAHFANPIKVDDAHKDIVDKIGDVNTTLGKLKDIKDEVTNIKNKVDGLKIYMDTGKLVGEIAGPLNRKLGNTANVSP